MSKLIQTRVEFQELAELRLVEAKALLDLGRWDGAYYLAGYAVELALKASIIKWLMETDAFPDVGFSKGCYTHNVGDLAKLAKLYEPLKNASDKDPDLKINWDLVKDWSEQKRYHRIHQMEAEELYRAIDDNLHGVLQWIKARW